MNRRSFLSKLGIGAAVVVTNPISLLEVIAKPKILYGVSPVYNFMQATYTYQVFGKRFVVSKELLDDDSNNIIFVEQFMKECLDD